MLSEGRLAFGDLSSEGAYVRHFTRGNSCHDHRHSDTLPIRNFAVNGKPGKVLQRGGHEYDKMRLALFLVISVGKDREGSPGPQRHQPL